MKRQSHCRAILAAALAAASLFASAHALAQDAAGAGAASKVMVIAHRGGAMNRPENTLPAFEHALRLGVDVLEFDMEMTADDQIVIYHDSNINPDFCKADAGSGLSPGPIRGLTLAETQRFDCGSDVRPAYAGKTFVTAPGARIPTLDQVLAGAKDSKAILFAETKIPKPSADVADIDPVKFATMLNDAVRKHGLEDRIILQSFDFRTIDALHALNPRIRTCLLGAPKLTRDYLALLKQHNATCIVLSDKDVDAAGIRALKEAGILLFSNVTDREEEWRTYLDLDVPGIFTNDPEGLIAFLAREGRR